MKVSTFLAKTEKKEKKVCGLRQEMKLLSDSQSSFSQTKLLQPQNI